MDLGMYMDKLYDDKFEKADLFKKDALSIIEHRNFEFLHDKTSCVLEEIYSGGKIKTIYTVKTAGEVSDSQSEKGTEIKSNKKKRKKWIYVYHEHYLFTHVSDLNNENQYELRETTPLVRIDHQKLKDRIEQHDNQCLKRFIVD